MGEGLQGQLSRTGMRRICVFTGSSAGTRPHYRAAAEELGTLLAQRGIGLVYSGAHVGLMGVVADAALALGGEVIGVIPTALVKREIAHPRLTDLRIVASMHERKATMADLADGFIALPGGLGTLEEFLEILTWGQLGLHRKPCGLLNVQGYFVPLLSLIEHAIDEGFIKRQYRPLITVSASPPALLDALAECVPPGVEKVIDQRAT
jgi:hypothetical protein